MQRHEDGNMLSLEWESCEDFERDKAKLSQYAIGQVTRPRSYSNDAWYGHKDGYPGFTQAIARGWPELRAILAAMLAGIERDLPLVPSYAETRRRKRRRGDAGDELDMGRVWNGELDKAWTRPVKDNRLATDQRRVTVVINTAMGHTISNEKAMWKAALAMLVCDSLIRTGRSVEIWSVASCTDMWTQGRFPLTTLAWCVKKTSEPVLMDRLATMVSVGFFRTYGFLAMHTQPDLEVIGYRGYPCNIALPHTLKEREDRGEVVVRIDRCYTKQEAIAQYQQIWKTLHEQKEAA